MPFQIMMKCEVELAMWKWPCISLNSTCQFSLGCDLLNQGYSPKFIKKMSRSVRESSASRSIDAKLVLCSCNAEGFNVSIWDPESFLEGSWGTDKLVSFLELAELGRCKFVSGVWTDTQNCPILQSPCCCPKQHDSWFHGIYQMQKSAHGGENFDGYGKESGSAIWLRKRIICCYG